MRTVNTCFLKWTSAVLLMSILAGCGGGGNGGGDGTPPPPPSPKFTIGGTVSGLQGSLVLRNNAQDDLTVTADGSFTFATSIETGGPYLVTIQTQPAAQDCAVANGSGTVADANVVSVTVTCGALQTTQLQADPNVHSANLSWIGPHNATFNVYVSSAPHCDIQNYSACPDGAVLENVTSPLMVEELRNGQAYFFEVDTTLSDGAHQLSNEASARPNVLAFNNRIGAIASGDDGTQYVGGEFTAVGIASGGAALFGAASGQPAMPDFPIVTGEVLATVSDGDGGWYIGGRFTRVGGQAHEDLAHIRANGTVDQNFNQDFNNNEIYALAFSGDTLYVGGQFSSVDNQQRNGLAAFGTDGSLRDWNPDAGVGEVFTLAVADDVVYAGGSFTGIGAPGTSVPRNRLAAIGVNGTLLPWDPNMTGNAVTALEVAGNTVYVGGRFTAVGGIPRHNLAAIRTAGELLAWSPDANFTVTALAVAGNTVYVAGGFSTISGQARNGLAAIDAVDAGQLRAWQPDPGNGFVTDLQVAGDTVYAGGLFDSIDGIKRSNLAAISTDGQVLAWNPAANNTVLALGIAGDTVFAGGQFTALASATRNHLAAIDGHGRLTAWNPDVNASVAALAVAENTVYAGGSFNQVADHARNHLAAIGTDGALLDWSPGTDDNGDVSALAISGSTVYAGGAFTQVTTAQGTQARGHLAAIGTNGTLLDWNPSANDRVNTLLVSGSTVYVGGVFTEIKTADGTEIRNHLAAIGTDGKLSTWDPNADARVRALAIIDDTLYVGGDFTTIGGNGGEARKFLAAIGTDGMLSTWQANADNSVRALAVSGHTLYIGGVFANIAAKHGIKQRHGLAAIDVTVDLLDWNPDASSTVYALAIRGDTVYAGGSFNTLGVLPRFSFGAINAGGIGEVIP